MTVYFEHSFQRAFGTFPLQGEELANAINHAIACGYRAFDTAQMYGNEAEVGAALASSDIPRDDLLITTKVEHKNFTESAFLTSVEESLKKLNIDYVDVLLLHWPPADGDIAPSLKLLEKAADEGLSRHIGISNYTAQMMRDAKKIVSRPLVTNQVEFHPLLNQDILLAASIETGIPLSSYCSVARGEVFKQSLFSEIATQYGKTPGQIVLRWILQTGVTINTMSTKPANIAANFNVMDFTLSNIEMVRINALTHSNYRIVDKSKVSWAPDFD